MRNLNRGYLRIALAVGLTVGPLFTWFVANLPNPDFHGLPSCSAGTTPIGSFGSAWASAR